MAEHEHGSMDTSNQEAVFDGFIAWVKWSSIIIILIIVFLALAAV